ncbi:MAG: multidomain protein with s-layer y region, glug motif, ig motif, i-set domain, pkd domain [Paenibacillaceae bacterium]|jgi:hypothetical protein|nr:multidomain protein with s-layer y region, glug motif, ig motif, i-set domain, pkd domain [Paenibacillaceae bacterium]
MSLLIDKKGIAVKTVFLMLTFFWLLSAVALAGTEADRTVSLQGGSGYRGETVAVSLRIDEVKDLSGLQILISYDGSRLETKEANVRPTEILAGFYKEGHVIAGKSYLKFSAASLEKRAQTGESVLLTVDFTIKNNAPDGYAPLQLSAILASANGQKLPVTVREAGINVLAAAGSTNEPSNGSSNGPSSQSSYKATVSGTGIPNNELPVRVDLRTGNAGIELGADAYKLFASRASSVITVGAIPGVNAYTLTLPASVLASTVKRGELTVATGSGSFTIPDNMLSGMTGIDGKKVSITISEGDKTVLRDDVKAAIGSRPLIRLSLVLDGEPASWSNPEATVTVAIPYKPAAAELADAEHIVAWFIDGNGNVVPVPSGRYDPASQTVTFTTTHFSHYAAAFVQKAFSDLGSHAWAKQAAEVLASKGIIDGTGYNLYSPANNITRADFMLLLVKTLGLTASLESNFVDVQPGDYYYEAVGVAKKRGISDGIGDNLFAPAAFISRQDMMTLTARALKAYRELEIPADTRVLDAFSDQGDIAGYAAESLAALVRAGLVEGTDKGSINPQGFASRAEAAVFLYRIYNQQ